MLNWFVFAPGHWAEFFFYPVPPRHCPICGYPADNNTEQCCRWRPLQLRSRTSAFLSYTWGRSRSPAYAFKVRKDFDEELRIAIAELFGFMAWSRFRQMSDEAVVIGVPPRRSFQWGMQDHLEPLLSAVEEVNFQVLRGVLAFSGSKNDESLIFRDEHTVYLFRGKPVIIIDNLWKTGRTAMAVALKLLENGATGAHFCMMSRWIEGDAQAITLAKEYRAAACENPASLYQWYRDVYCDPSGY